MVRCALPISLVAAWTASQAPDDRIDLSFVPVEGAEVEITYELSARSTTLSEAWCPIVDGVRREDEGGEMDGGDPSSFRVACRFADRYTDVRDGRVHSLVRSYEDLGGHQRGVDVEGEAYATELESPLEGRRVEFDGDEVRFVDEEHDETAWDDVLLADLRIDAFGNWFLPDAPDLPVAIGDEWKLDAKVWSDFVDLGGELWLDEPRVDPPDEEWAELQRARVEQARENADGDIVCELVDVRDVDGVQVAVIAIEVDLETRTEVRFRDEADTEDGALDVVEVVVDETVAEGECHWDIAAKRPLSIVFDVEVGDTTTETETIDDGGERYSVEWRTVTESTARVVVRFDTR